MEMKMGRVSVILAKNCKKPTAFTIVIGANDDEFANTISARLSDYLATLTDDEATKLQNSLWLNTQRTNIADVLPLYQNPDMAGHGITNILVALREKNGDQYGYSNSLHYCTTFFGGHWLESDLTQYGVW